MVSDEPTFRISRSLEYWIRSSSPDPKVGFPRGHLFYADFQGVPTSFMYRCADKDSSFSRYASIFFPSCGLIPYACLDDVPHDRIAAFVDFSRFCSAIPPVVDRLLLFPSGQMRLYVCASSEGVPLSRDISSIVDRFDGAHSMDYERWMVASVSRLMHGFDSSRSIVRRASDARSMFDYLFTFGGGC